MAALGRNRTLRIGSPPAVGSDYDGLDGNREGIWIG